jgi:spore germination protein GerM
MKHGRYVVIAVLAVCLGAGAFLLYRYLAVEQLADTPQGVMPEAQVSGQMPTRWKAHIYFADAEQRYLTAEARTMTSPDHVADRAKAMAMALIEGPSTALGRTIPEGVRLLALHVTEDGVAYVDFSREIRDRHPGGTLSELLTIFSVVNTLALNLPEVEAVKIVIEGQEEETLAGHIDIRSAFQPDLLMIK